MLVVVPLGRRKEKTSLSNYRTEKILGTKVVDEKNGFATDPHTHTYMCTHVSYSYLSQVEMFKNHM